MSLINNLRNVGFSFLIGVSLPYSIQNSYAGEKWYNRQPTQEEIQRRNEMINHPIRTAKEQYERFKRWDGSPESKEFAKDAAGKILEDVYQIPKSREMIEWMDEQNKKDLRRRKRN